jgi:16S rRNA (uracil1498-N3)-methyltransferase
MARYDFATHRLFVPGIYGPDAKLPLEREAMNYLLNVLRMSEGAKLLVFNGEAGEWLGTLHQPTRKTAVITLERQTRPQPLAGRVGYAFAPLKAARLDYMVQKAVETGAARLTPVLTQRTQISRLKEDRISANAIEAAEQCGVLALPEVKPEVKLHSFLAGLEAETLLVFADEDADIENPIEALRAARDSGSNKVSGAIEVLVGPEGGFTADERALILKHPNLCRLSLGPRILRADTAAVAALTLVQATLGDLGEISPESGTLSRR